jgi:hypothetical protein
LNYAQTRSEILGSILSNCYLHACARADQFALVFVQAAEDLGLAVDTPAITAEAVVVIAAAGGRTKKILLRYICGGVIYLPHRLSPVALDAKQCQAAWHILRAGESAPMIKAEALLLNIAARGLARCKFYAGIELRAANRSQKLHTDTLGHVSVKVVVRTTACRDTRQVFLLDFTSLVVEHRG